jgi:Zn finger protein HypA/HybF involved in hydrogenase expression
VLIAMATLVAALGGYAVLCAVKPFGPCRRCRGAGEIERFRKARPCPRCRGKRLRLRVGRRAHNAWRRTHQAGVR